MGFKMEFARLYEDTNFEKEMKSIVSKDFKDIIKDTNHFEYYYFLSDLRHNLFNWYPFKKEESLLEIGAGYGQLTSLFTQKLNHVVAVENTQSKAEIISKKANNAEVIVCEFDKLGIDEKFDYIVLCDIFEYAKSFHESENPYEDYLEYLKSFLKPTGIILIAISNRLGLKYFAGFREEHTNQFFTGIDGYPKADNVETFTKSELIRIVQNAGFDNCKFFYPCPDHVFPEIINTDVFVNKMPYAKKSTYFNQRSNLFREDVLIQTLANDDMADYFANSFLIEIRNSDNEYETDNIDFVKINAERKPEFQTATIIKSDKTVCKSPISKKSQPHIKKMHEESDGQFGKIRYLNSDYDNGQVSYEFLEGKSLENLIMESIFRNDKEQFFEIIEDYYDALFYKSYEADSYSSDNFLSIFKKKSKEKFHCNVKSNIGLDFSNIFRIDGELIAIDYEWIFNFPIPIEYIFYRTIKHQMESNDLFNDFTSFTEIYRHFNLNMGNIELFEIWDKNLSKYIYGGTPVNEHEIIPKENLDYPEKVDEYVDSVIESKNMDSAMFDSLKRDIVLNQRKIINQKNSELKKKDNELKNKNKQIKNKNKEIKEMLNSTSWKITKPLRKLMSLFK